MSRLLVIVMSWSHVLLGAFVVLKSFLLRKIAVAVAAKLRIKSEKADA